MHHLHHLHDTRWPWSNWAHMHPRQGAWKIAKVWVQLMYTLTQAARQAQMLACMHSPVPRDTCDACGQRRQRPANRIHMMGIWHNIQCSSGIDVRLHIAAFVYTHHPCQGACQEPQSIFVFLHRRRGPPFLCWLRALLLLVLWCQDWRRSYLQTAGTISMHGLALYRVPPTRRMRRRIRVPLFRPRLRAPRQQVHGSTCRRMKCDGRHKPDHKPQGMELPLTSSVPPSPSPLSLPLGTPPLSAERTDRSPL